MSHTQRFELVDQILESEPPVEGIAILADGQAWLGAEGYEDYHGTAQLVLLERANGRLVLRVWADKSSEEPTHVISLEGARA